MLFPTAKNCDFILCLFPSIVLQMDIKYIYNNLLLEGNMKQEVKIDCRYFVEMIQETRALLRDMRQRLDELENVCNDVCDRALPAILEEERMAEKTNIASAERDGSPL